VVRALLEPFNKPPKTCSSSSMAGRDRLRASQRRVLCDGGSARPGRCRQAIACRLETCGCVAVHEQPFLTVNNVGRLLRLAGVVKAARSAPAPEK